VRRMVWRAAFWADLVLAMDFLSRGGNAPLKNKWAGF
jgi:hypothetical protein